MENVNLSNKTLVAAAATGTLAVAAGAYALVKSQCNKPKVLEEFIWSDESHAGQLVGKVLKAHGVEVIFTLCGGHISPILLGCKELGINVVDVRHEANAAFAADGISRTTGTIGVCAVTAGPGVSNVLTPVKNAELAQTPMLVLGGATATILKGRRALQDIDQFALIKNHVKFSAGINCVKEVVPTLEKAIAAAFSGTPGPVFVELPLDVLYPKSSVLEEFSAMAPPPSGLTNRLIRWYIMRHAHRLYRGLDSPIKIHEPLPITYPTHSARQVKKVLRLLQNASKPVFVVGSQVALRVPKLPDVVDSLKHLGVPTWVSGASRGLLGTDDIRLKHRRSGAFKACDVLVLFGVPQDFRLGYGMKISRRVTIVAVNLDYSDLYVNRSPDVPVFADPASFIIALANEAPATLKASFLPWLQTCQQQDQEREEEIDKMGAIKSDDAVNPITLCRALERHMSDNSVLIGDGGDFVATASYIVNPRKPLSWLDPGPFGTLGVGAGFAMAAKLANPQDEVWLLWGDGASGFSISDLDTCVRHNIPIIALIGNDACWTQIYRDQVVRFKDDVGCMLDFTHYEEVAKGFGAEGLLLEREEDLDATLALAKRLNAEGKTVVINAKIARTKFREGSISV